MSYDGFTKYNEKIANSYDNDRQEEEHWYLENNYIKNRYKDKSIDRILDLPVGTGRFLAYYTNIKEIYGCDISDDMLVVAKSNSISIKKNITLAKEDAFNLSFPNNYFDEIICFRLLHLIPNNLRQKLLFELARVVQKKIILQVYIDKDLTFLDKVINKFKGLLKRETKIDTDAWNHIQSYPLSIEELNSLIDISSMQISKKVFLCQYGGLNIYVYELSKNPNK